MAVHDVLEREFHEPALADGGQDVREETCLPDVYAYIHLVFHEERRVLVVDVEQDLDGAAERTARRRRARTLLVEVDVVHEHPGIDARRKQDGHGRIERVEVAHPRVGAAELHPRREGAPDNVRHPVLDEGEEGGGEAESSRRARLGLRQRGDEHRVELERSVVVRGEELIVEQAHERRSNVAVGRRALGPERLRLLGGQEEIAEVDRGIIVCGATVGRAVDI
mmetsp:Transcript_45640/g.84666  ORF Transcript_45640/g.84666 Transcript_45640/m.84666 type:complete len:223 (-) Transcript_45640:343-1011(-)